VSRRAIYATVGAGMGALASFLGLWVQTLHLDSQETFGVRTITRAATANVQSTVAGAAVVFGPALALALVVALIARKQIAR